MGSGKSKSRVEIGEDVVYSIQDKSNHDPGGRHPIKSCGKLYAESVFEHLRDMRKNGDLCDINVKINDSSASFPAHRCILAAASPYFRQQLLDEPGDHHSNGDVKQDASAESDQRKPSSSSLLSPKYSSNKFSNLIHVDFPVSSRTMAHVLTFIYSGELTAVDLDAVGEVLDAAIKLKIVQLERRCVIEIKQKFDIERFQATLSLARRLNLDSLAEFALLKALEKFDELVEAECYKSVTENELQELMAMRIGNISDKRKPDVAEVSMFNAVLRWQGIAKSKPKKETVIGLLRNIQYKNIPKATLSGHVVEQNLVKDNPDLLEEIRKLVGADKKRVLNRLRHQISLSDDLSITKLLVAKQQPTKPTIVVTGGRLFDQFSSVVQEYGYKQGASCKEMTRLPSIVSYHSVTVVDNVLYVCGGMDTTMTGAPALASAWAFDPTSNSWETLPNMQHSRSHFYLGRLKDCIIAVGGKSNKTMRNTAEKYCTVSRKWEFIPSLKQQRYSHAGAYTRNSLFVSGGIVKKTSSDSLMRYELGTIQWCHLSPMRSARSNHAMAVVKDRIFVFGGEIEKQGISQPVECALECYTMQCDQWHTIAEKFNFPNEKECCCVTMDGFVYLLGGCRGNVTDHRNDVSRYDPDSDTWKSQAKLIRKFRGGACAVLSLN